MYIKRLSKIIKQHVDLFQSLYILKSFKQNYIQINIACHTVANKQ